MAGDRFLVEVDESALENNPAVAASLRGEGGSGQKKDFSDRDDADDWCERMTRIGSKELEIVPQDAGIVDARVVAADATAVQELDDDDGEEGGFDDFLDDAF